MRPPQTGRDSLFCLRNACISRGTVLSIIRSAHSALGCGFPIEDPGAIEARPAAEPNSALRRAKYGWVMDGIRMSFPRSFLSTLFLGPKKGDLNLMQPA